MLLRTPYKMQRLGVYPISDPLFTSPLRHSLVLPRTLPSRTLNLNLDLTIHPPSAFAYHPSHLPPYNVTHMSINLVASVPWLRIRGAILVVRASLDRSDGLPLIPSEDSGNRGGGVDNPLKSGHWSVLLPIGQLCCQLLRGHKNHRR